jgi:hypothetical protein
MKRGPAGGMGINGSDTFKTGKRYDKEIRQFNAAPTWSKKHLRPLSLTKQQSDFKGKTDI